MIKTCPLTKFDHTQFYPTSQVRDLWGILKSYGHYRLEHSRDGGSHTSSVVLLEMVQTEPEMIRTEPRPRGANSLGNEYIGNKRQQQSFFQDCEEVPVLLGHFCEWWSLIKGLKERRNNLARSLFLTSSSRGLTRKGIDTRDAIKSIFGTCPNSDAAKISV